MYYNNNPIKISSKPFINQTRKYLVQQIQHYDEEFMSNIRNNNIVVYAIHDHKMCINGSKKIEPHIYMLFDVNGESKYNVYVDKLESRRQFQKSLEFFKNHHSYVTDYCYDSNKTGHLHVVVVKLPFPEKLHKFIKGNYSEMYSEEELHKWFPKYYKKVKTDQWCVLTKDPEYKPRFIQQLKEEFGDLKILEKDLDGELDFPPVFKNEILRYDI